MPTRIVQELKSIVAQFGKIATTKMDQWQKDRDPAAFIGVEQAAHALGLEVADELVALVLRHILGDAQFTADCISKARATDRFRPNCRRTTSVTMVGGNTHRVHTPYVAAIKRSERRGRTSPNPAEPSRGDDQPSRRGNRRSRRGRDSLAVAIVMEIPR